MSQRRTLLFIRFYDRSISSLLGRIAKLQLSRASGLSEQPAALSRPGATDMPRGTVRGWTSGLRQGAAHWLPGRGLGRVYQRTRLLETVSKYYRSCPHTPSLTDYLPSSLDTGFRSRADLRTSSRCGSSLSSPLKQNSLRFFKNLGFL